MGQNSIVIKGAREHNLKNVDLEIPRDKLVVITGLSGSGKSSLAFDTMYAEGQRRYVESLSSYARMFLGQMSKPDLDSIDGLSPAVSIDQKTTSRNPRSTVGTTTEIYDYLRLLFARVGIPHCPECGRVIKKQTTDQVTDDILALAADESTRAIIMAPVVTGRKGEFTKLFADLAKEGFSRVRIDGEIVKLTGEPITLNKKIKHFIDVVVDRVVLKKSATTRIAESVENATKLAEGRVLVQVLGPNGKPQGEVGGTSSGATGGLAQGNTSSRLRSPVPNMVIPWTNFSRATSPSTHRTAPAPTAWASVVATRLTPRSWCPTRRFPSMRASSRRFVRGTTIRRSSRR